MAPAPVGVVVVAVEEKSTESRRGARISLSHRRSPRARGPSPRGLHVRA